MEFRLFTSTLRRFRFLVLALAVVGAIAGGGRAVTSARTYQALATVRVAQPDLSLLTNSQSVLDTAQYTLTEVGVIQSNTVLKPAAQQTGVPLPIVYHSLAISQRGTSDLIDIIASRPSAVQAAQIANLVATTYLSQQEADINELLSGATTKAQARLSTLESQLNRQNIPAAEATSLSTEVGQVSQEINNLEVTTQVALADTEIVQTATVPTAPKPRHSVEFAGVGMIAGLILGVLIAVVVAALRPRMLRRSDVEDAIGVDAVAELPYVSARKQGERAGAVGLDWQEHAGFADEVAKVGVFVEAARSVRNCKTVLITSLEPGAGVSTVAGALATMLRDSNRIVRLSGLPSLREREAPRREREAPALREREAPALAERDGAARPERRDRDREVPARREREGPRPERRERDREAQARRERESPARPEREALVEAQVAERRYEAAGADWWSKGRDRSAPPIERAPLSAGAFVRPSRPGSRQDDDYEVDMIVIDGGSLRDSVSVVALARTTDVTVLVVPLPNQNERYLNAVLRATFDDAKGQLLVVTNNLTGRGSRQVGTSA